MSNLDRQLEILETKFNHLAEKEIFQNGGIYWALMRGSVTSNKSVRLVIYENDTEGDKDESLTLLKEQISFGFECGDKRQHVRFHASEDLKGAPDATHPILISPEKEKSAGIYGFSGSGQNSLLPFIGSIQQRSFDTEKSLLDRINQLERERSEDKMNRVIESLNDKIEGIQSENKAWYEKAGNAIGSFAQTDAGAVAIAKIGSLLENLLPIFLSKKGLAGLGAIESNEISEEDLEWLEIKDELENIYDGDPIQWAKMFIFFMQHEPGKYLKYQSQIQAECVLKQKELENDK